MYMRICTPSTLMTMHAMHVWVHMSICNAILIADYREMILHTVWHARDASWSAAAAACMLAASLYEMLWRCHAVICTLAYVCLRSLKRYLQGKDSKYLASMYTYLGISQMPVHTFQCRCGISPHLRPRLRVLTLLGLHESPPFRGSNPAWSRDKRYDTCNTGEICK